VPDHPARVLVVGGAVLDTKLRTTGTPVLGTSNPGSASWTPGGVGRNIAENLARLGRATVLLTAVGDDIAGESVLGRTAAAGVDCRHVVISSHPTGTYAAVLDDDGDLLVAVADMRATDELAVVDLAALPGLLATSGAVVADANLDTEVVRWVVAAAAAAGVPVVLEPVSVAKATGLAAVLDDGQPVHTVTPNVDELAALVGAHLADTVDDVVRAARRLHERGVEHVWVRRGRRGSLLSTRARVDVSRVVLVGAPPVEVADVTGAGDSMTAGYVHALLDGADVVEAARYGQVLAALTCASPDTVRADLTEALVTARLTASHPPTEELVR
jgi:pseudouridine kinase